MGINRSPHILLLCCLLLPCILEGIHASQIKYIVHNNARNHRGGIIFDEEIGCNKTLQMMKNFNRLIWTLFEQHSSSERKNVSVVKLIISNSSNHISFTVGNTINIKAAALENQPSKNELHSFFGSILVREMTHVFQWTGNGGAPRGLIEGIAEYVEVKANYSNPTKPGEGKNWDEGYGVTERFLEYCASLRKGFIASLNKKMRDAYSDDYFWALLGKTVQNLWEEYKATHRNG